MRTPLHAFIAATLVLSACSAGTGDVTEDAGTAIGAEGGVVASDGAQVTIPSGALGEETVIDIVTVDDVEPPPSVQAGPIHAFLPHGTTFDVPVEIALAVPDGQTAPAIWTRADDATTWTRLESTVDGDVVKASVTHFSYFVAASTTFSWERVTAFDDVNTDGDPVFDFGLRDGELFVATGHDVFRTADGAAFEDMSSGLDDTDIYYSAVAFAEGNQFFFLGGDDGVYRFNGSGWSPAGTPLDGSGAVFSIVEMLGVGGNAYAIGIDSLTVEANIFRYNPAGQSFSKVAPETDTCSTAFGAAGHFSSHIYVSCGGLRRWSFNTPDLPPEPVVIGPGPFWIVRALHGDFYRNVFFAATDRGVYRSDDGTTFESIWPSALTSIRILAFAELGGGLTLAVGDTDHAYLSEDGRTWSIVDDGLETLAPGEEIQSAMRFGSSIYVGTSFGAIYQALLP